jgi:hypothetical protein
VIFLRSGKCLLVSVLLLFLLIQPASACPELMPVKPVTEQQYPIYIHLLHCLAVYESFLSERDQIDDLLFPIHGHSVQQAQSYLQQGFTCSFSNNLLLYLTRWNHEYERLQLIPGEGFPLLVTADFHDLYYQVLDDGSIIFQRDYYDCYRSGDRWHFRLTIGEYPQGWLIQSLTLMECPYAH